MVPTPFYKQTSVIYHGIQIITIAIVLKGLNRPPIISDIELVVDIYPEIKVKERITDYNLTTSLPRIKHPEILKEFYKLMDIKIQH